jgi:hypothetical protein
MAALTHPVPRGATLQNRFRRFPALGTIGFVSTFTAANSLTCADLKAVDPGPLPSGMTPERLQQFLKPALQ